MRNRFGNRIGRQRIERKRQFPGEYGRYLAMCPLQPSPFTPDFFIKPALLIKHALFYTTSNRIIKFLMIFLKSRRKSMTPLERQGSGAIVLPVQVLRHFHGAEVGLLRGWQCPSSKRGKAPLHTSVCAEGAGDGCIWDSHLHRKVPFDT